MLGTLKSIGSDLARTNEGRVRAASVTEEDLPEGADQSTPEALAITRQQIEALQGEFVDADQAFYILECVADGFTPREIRKKLDLSAKEYDAARKLITRRLAKFFLSN
jgi:hypothetical protein